jgi:hypothetical protein
MIPIFLNRRQVEEDNSKMKNSTCVEEEAFTALACRMQIKLQRGLHGSV